jgi:hypothetical protein
LTILRAALSPDMGKGTARLERICCPGFKNRHRLPPGTIRHKPDRIRP